MIDLHVDYKFYADTYGGLLIKEFSFKPLAAKVEARLDRYTFGRLGESWPIEAKTAVCEMMECLYNHEKQDGKISENNDGYSVTFDSSKNIDSTMYKIAEIYLANTGLMDLGVDQRDYEC